MSVVGEDGPLLAGTSRSLLCTVSGSVTSVVQFSWRRNGSPLVNNSRVLLSTDSHNTSSLQFNPLRTSDGGLYQCEVTLTNNTEIVNVTGDIELNVTGEDYVHKITSSLTISIHKYRYMVLIQDYI